MLKKDVTGNVIGLTFGGESRRILVAMTALAGGYSVPPSDRR
ncbi:hypothetical protein [Candidatus Symbiopectobacterium sp. NZEC135]|nr:hypothetical protein [Candidatus Symbiopectobacterium sp. NZEC135]